MEWGGGAGSAQGFEKWHGTCKVMSNSITIYNTYNNNQNQEVIL